MKVSRLLALRSFAGFLLCVLAGSSASGEPPSGRLKVKAATEQAVVPAATSSDYRLCPNDVVHIKVFQEEDLETTARIAKNGTITIPLIKNSTVGGLTRQEAELRIEGQLKEYLVRPQVSVRIVEYTKRRFTVLGQVSEPGAIEMPDDGSVDLLEAIGMAGGYTRIARPSKITVKRKVNGREVIYKLDGTKMANEESSTRFEIQAGDTIFVGESIF